MYFELFNLASNNIFPVSVNLTKKSLTIDITFILDTDIKTYQDLRMDMIYFHILLVHFGGNACFEYIGFTVYGELHS